MSVSFTIITPSLARASLIACCESVNNQTLKDGWQHIVQIDQPELDDELIAKIQHPQREIYCCGVRHNNFGNTCRHLAWDKAIGEFQIVLDDDNTFYHTRVLKQIQFALASANFPDFAIFPILRHGSIFFNDPPGLCQTDTANVVVKREIGRWPDGTEYTMDGIWVEALKAKYSYAAFPNMHPIVLMEQSSEGK